MGGFDFGQMMNNPLFMQGLQMMANNRQQPQQPQQPGMMGRMMGGRQPNQNDLLRQLLMSGLFGGMGGQPNNQIPQGTD